MLTQPVAKNELERMHLEVLLANIQDFLCFGGGSQIEPTRLAMSELMERFEKRAKSVRGFSAEHITL